jgi:hypothetical protein
MKFNIWAFLEDLSIELKFQSNLSTIMDTLHEDVFRFMTISH